jgi:hypothetical protein
MLNQSRNSAMKRTKVAIPQMMSAVVHRAESKWYAGTDDPPDAAAGPAPAGAGCPTSGPAVVPPAKSAPQFKQWLAWSGFSV